MSKNELGLILRDMYSNADEGDKVANIHLFGIKYANEIVTNKYGASEIIRIAGLNNSYSTELSKGIKLARYVVER